MSDDPRRASAQPPPADGARDAPAAAEDAGAAAPPSPLEDYLPERPAPAPPLPTGLRAASLQALDGRAARVLVRGQPAPVAATVAPEVELELLREALPGGTVLVDVEPSGVVHVIGILATRRPRELRLRAGTISIEGDDEVLLRAGRSAVRLRADGDVEVVGSRISAASRGVFKIVGRLLRLN